MSTLLNPEIQESITGYIKEGLPNSDAAKLSGITLNTMNRWLQRGRDDEADQNYRTKFFLFYRSVQAARSHFKKVNLEQIRRAATQMSTERRVRKTRMPDGTEHIELIQITRPPVWQAAAWLLERNFPGEYSRRTVDSKSDNQQETGVLIIPYIDDAKWEEAATSQQNRLRDTVKEMKAIPESTNGSNSD